MRARAFRYDFTMKELKYYLFNKKIVLNVIIK